MWRSSCSRMARRSSIRLPRSCREPRGFASLHGEICWSLISARTYWPRPPWHLHAKAPRPARIRKICWLADLHIRDDVFVGDKVGYQISRKVHDRWLTRLNRHTAAPGYLEEWHRQQCGSCRRWIPLSGQAGLDWGACTHEQSEFDGQVRFEHDGCPHYEDAGGWRTPPTQD